MKRAKGEAQQLVAGVLSNGGEHVSGDVDCKLCCAIDKRRTTNNGGEG